jgi:hypothetical protein
MGGPRTLHDYGTMSPDEVARLRAFVARNGVYKAKALLGTSATMIDKLLGGGAAPEAQQRIMLRLAELEKG